MLCSFKLIKNLKNISYLICVPPIDYARLSGPIYGYKDSDKQELFDIYGYLNLDSDSNVSSTYSGFDKCPLYQLGNPARNKLGFGVYELNFENTYAPSQDILSYFESV